MREEEDFLVAEILPDNDNIVKEKVPTRKHPEILVTVVKDCTSGECEILPKEIFYPKDTYSPEFVQNAEATRRASPENCPLCKRIANELRALRGSPPAANSDDFIPQIQQPFQAPGLVNKILKRL